MGKKNKKNGLEQYLSILRGEPWKSDGDYRDSKKYWNNHRLQAKSPAGYDDFKQRERSYQDAKEARKSAPQQQQRQRGPSGLSRENIDRDSGEFQDIKYAIREDAQLGYDAAEKLKNKAVSSGLANKDLLDRLDSLMITGIPGGTSGGFTEEQKSVARLLGIKNLANPVNQNKIKRAIAGAKPAGVKNLNSANDLKKIEAYYKANPDKEPTFPAFNSNDKSLQPRTQDQVFAQMLQPRGQSRAVLQGFPTGTRPNFQTNLAIQGFPTGTRQSSQTNPAIASAMTPAEIRAFELNAMKNIGMTPAEQQRHLSIGEAAQRNYAKQQMNGGGYGGGMFGDLAIATQQMENSYQQQLSDQASQFQAQFDQTTQLMNEQLASANAALELAEQRANNMMNAFVPQANPNALSVAYGDDRSSGDPGARKIKDNSLSSLSILSGLGTKANPLAGLQLA